MGLAFRKHTTLTVDGNSFASGRTDINAKNEWDCFSHGLYGQIGVLTPNADARCYASRACLDEHGRRTPACSFLTPIMSFSRRATRIPARTALWSRKKKKERRVEQH